MKSNAIQKQTKQTLDQYGNLTQMQVYNYGNLQRRCELTPTPI